MLKLSSVSKCFGNEQLFKSLSFEFPKTGLFLLRGESGTGKTTLLRMIAGLDTDYHGEIAGGGPSKISYAFQEHRLLPSLSALDNVALVLEGPIHGEAAQKKAAESLKQIGFPTEDFKKKPDRLSGGMKQRVSLSRAFAVERPILLLDEPEKDLDTGLKALLFSRIEERSKSALVLLVSHTPEAYEQIATGSLSLCHLTFLCK